MTSRRRVWLMLLIPSALLLAGGLAWWLSQNLVKRSTEVYIGYGEAARRNPFYLAERLLTRLGATAHGVRRLDELPDPLDPADTLLVAIPTYALSAGEAQRLLNWVGQGGHLIIGVQHPYQPGQGRDHLLNPLQVRSEHVEPLTNDPIERAESRVDPISVQLRESLPPLQVNFRSSLRLNDAHWLVVRWGRGQATLLTDIDLFANERLVDHDHADFLWALFQQNSPGGVFWLQYRTLTPSLAHLLWQHAWMPLLGLSLTLLVLLWRSSRRLGPLLIPRSGEQRRLAEHLRASSRFLWRHEAGPMLLQAARHYAQRRRDRRSPGALPDAALLEHSDQPLNEHELIHTLQTLQRLNRPR
ncbi:MAG TPA: DUF4350 domain-containing protein [Candidatus Competibacteraceae bacterium]|nr:DUF4350 domain-containing protein [Candidatus Competibacteraceae bacterium]HRZ07511.1 DUF4350 domain-containing protein [Candidatus Competibacteraceae bacterium]HSA47918.1 DUF4350 domain-containing protein [Candidatus Competibacteraceae bacterium]